MPEYPKYNCSLIELPQGDLMVPLFCRLCGNCCRNYYVPVDIESLPAVSEALHKPIHAVQSILSERLEAYRQGRPADCCFLKEKRCLIHAVRPEACRQFPSFTDGAAGTVDCAAHREYKRVEKAFCREFQARISMPGSSRKLRPVPVKHWKNIMGILQKEDISRDFLSAFIALNMPFPASAGEQIRPIPSI